MRRPGPDEWKRLITEYEESGLAQKEFCDKQQTEACYLLTPEETESKNFDKPDRTFANSFIAS